MVACSRASNGGFDLAAKWMGWENIFHCEWNPFGQKILKYYWPNAISYDDITKTDFTIHRGRIDILTGGFPCQPYSVAGKRKGKEDERHLWPEMLRAIREIQPGWVVGENVGGLINWNGGMVFDEVQADLEAEGYEVWAYVLPACAVNAPHRRDRVWFIAHASGLRHNKRECEHNISEFDWFLSKNQSNFGNQVRSEIKRGGSVASYTASLRCNRNDGERTERIKFGTGWQALNKPDGNGREGNVADTDEYRFQGRQNNGSIDSIREVGEKQPARLFSPDWQNFPTQSPVCGGNDELPRELDGITFSKWRNESIKGFGNAIVPVVALQIFKTIELYNKTT